MTFSKHSHILYAIFVQQLLMGAVTRILKETLEMFFIFSNFSQQFWLTFFYKTCCELLKHWGLSPKYPCFKIQWSQIAQHSLRNMRSITLTRVYTWLWWFEWQHFFVSKLKCIYNLCQIQTPKYSGQSLTLPCWVCLTRQLDILVGCLILCGGRLRLKLAQIHYLGQFSEIECDWMISYFHPQ